MAFDEFFTDNDKPYAENLNDALLLLDAFDVTVPVSLPDMFSNGAFSDSIGVSRKAGVSIVNLMSVGSGVTVGTDSITGSGEVVFRVYPNFNGFYKWYSIIADYSGTVSIGFRKTDGTSISANISSTGIISDNSALKTLQAVDVVFTLTNATLSNILINFQNNHNKTTRTGAKLEASQLVNVNGTVASGNTEAVNGDTVNTAIANGLATKSDVGHTHTGADITNLFNLVYPVGSIYMSVNNTSPATLFGGTWEKIQGRFLLGSGTTSGTSKSYTLGGTAGSKDAVVVSHTHTQNSHTHVQNAHTHTQNSHTHVQNSHSHNNSSSDSGYKFLLSDGNIAVNGTARAATSSKSDGWFYVYTKDAADIIEKVNTANATATNQTSTAVNQSTVAVNQSATATNNSTGVSGTDANMPPYLVVNMWKRTA